MVVGEGSATHLLSRHAIRGIVETALPFSAVNGRRVLVIVPDGTRTMPLPLMADVLDESVRVHAAALDYLVALGTHQPMTDAQLSTLFGRPVGGGLFGSSRVFNHRWDDPATFVTVGTIGSAEIARLTGGLLARDVPVSLNRMILEYRPARDLRPGVPARGRGVLRRHQVPSARGSPARTSSISRTGSGRC